MKGQSSQVIPKAPRTSLHLSDPVMSGILLDKAYLSAIWLETLFYGMGILVYQDISKALFTVN